MSKSPRARFVEIPNLLIAVEGNPFPSPCNFTEVFFCREKRGWYKTVISRSFLFT